MGKRKEKGKTGKNLCRWVAVAGICLLFYGCGAASGTPEQTEGPRDPEGLQAQEGAKPGEEEPASSQVLEVGIMADGTNPYAVVASETFCRKAGESSYPIVVEYHDSRDGCDTQKAQLRGLKERGVDILLIHVVDLERQEELQEEIGSLDVPVLYFGARPGEELLEETKGEYVGLDEKQEAELLKTLEAEGFETSKFQWLAKKAGEDLYRLAVKKME